MEVRGDIIFVGNNILNRATQANPSEANTPYNGTANNNSLWMEYIDIDNDPTTFSSSSAELNLNDPDCSQVRYAGLYWAGTYPNERSTDGGAQFNGTPRIEEWNEIKFKVPGGAYVDLVADNDPDPAGQEDDIILNGYQPANPTTFVKDAPVICYKNITDLVRSNANPTGEYTAANIRATRGRRNGSSSAGWVMVIIYENPNESGKFISTFDGYASLSGAVGNVDVNVNGFRTLPAPFSVNARIGVGALEGDRGLTGDRFFIKANSIGAGFTNLTTGLNPANNFFNSTISTNGAEVPTRVPYGTNTLGTDLDIFNLGNQFNNVLPNDETGATLRFTSSGDGYGPFLATFSVEIIEPNIVLEKRVNTPGGVDITGQGVNLGQTLDYVLSFQNIGNDDVTNYTIRDVLPVNVSPPDGRSDFIDSDFSLPTGVTYVYDSVSKEVIFTIPDNLVLQDISAYSIRIRVKVAENCFDFIDACSDLIQNIAYSTYQGVENSAMVTDDPSVSDFSACGFVVAGATNFLLDDLADCNFERTVELCGSSAVLDAGDGFDSYVWVRDDNGNGQIDDTDTQILDGDPDNDPSTIVVQQEGTYIVDKIVADPCKGFKEIVTVVPYGAGTIPNPIIEFFNNVNGDSDPSNDIAGEIVQCSVDNDLLPKLFLCGIDDTKLLQVNIVDAQSIVWEQLDEGSCSASGDDCANKALTCTWSQVGTGNNYTVNSEGQYRLSVTYQNGCTSRFYYNVFQNNLELQYNKEDIVCNSPGNITITNLGTGYGYQLVDADTNTIVIPFSSNNGPSFNFGPGENGAYIVEVTQLDQSGEPIENACIFDTPVIGILDRDVTYAVTANDVDCNGFGSINVQVNNANADYTYELRQDDGANGGQGTLIDDETAQPNNNFTFTGLNAGNYIINVTTVDGCSYTEQATIVNTNNLALTARVSQHITCREGNILMDSGGGKTPHTYAIWSYVDDNGNTVTSYPTPQDIPSSEFQTSQIFDIYDPGDYTFVVVDRNNCFSFSNTVTIEFRPAAEFTPTSFTDVACFGDSSGTIQFNLVDDNGYQLTYYLFDNTTFDENNYDYANALATNVSGYFPNLPSGDYAVVITQRKGSASCDYFEFHTISAPSDALSTTSVLIQDYTCIQDAIIEAQNVTGGTAPYAYSIDGVTFIPDSTPNAHRFENITPGNYTLTVRDANNCVVLTDPILIEDTNPPSDITVVESQITCPAQTVNLQVTAVDGTAPFVYEIIAPTSISPNATSGNTADFNNLAPNTYTIRVTDVDGCFYEENYTIAPILPITISASTVQAVSCFGFADGTVQFNINYQAGQNFTYTVTGPSGPVSTGGVQATINLPNLLAGDYTLDIVDTDTNCTYSTTYTLEGTPSALSVASQSVTQPTCLNDGSVVISATGGWGSYEYTLVNPDSSPFGTNTNGSFNGLTQGGTYTGTVTDANNCVVPFTFDLTAATIPVLELTPNNVCYDDTVGLTITANVTSGGDGNFEYNLNGGTYSGSSTFSGLAPGTYTVNVRDGNSCTDTQSITINPELSVIASAGNITACAADTDIDITAAGGYGNYVFAVVADGVTPTTVDFSITNPVTVNFAGDYDVYVRDNSGNVGYCEDSYDINIQQDAPLAITVANTPILCSGDNQASVTITTSGGEAPYRYSINNGATYQTSNTFNNLGAGNYNISVRDINNCEITQTYSITEPFTLSASAAVTQLIECNPSDGAEVRITNAQGGTAPYTYSFDGGLTYGTDAIGYLLAGTHTLYIQDTNGCTFPMNVIIEQAPTPPNVTLTPTVDYSCDGTGIVTISPDDASLDYTYSINGNPNSPADSNVFTDVPVGTHTISVDYISNAAPVPSTLLLESFGTGVNTSITQIDPAYCYEPQDGTASACGFGTDTHIQDGEYSVTQTIINPYGSWLSPIDHSGETNGRFLAINVGGVAGVGGIVYAKRNIEVIPNRDITVALWAFNLLRNGTSGGDPTIEIQLVDGSGTVIASTATGNVPKNNGANDWQDYSVTLNPGANTNLDIVIRTNSAVVNGNDIAIDDIEAYQLPEQCSQTVTIDVTVEDGNAFEASIVSSADVACNGDNTGSITFDVDNFGAGGFEYSLDDFATTLGSSTTSPQTISGLSSGNYTVYVRDVDNPIAGCTVTLTHTINEPTSIVASASITEQFLCTNAGATITANATGGTPTYEYQLEDTLGGIITAYQTGTTFTSVPAGDYVVRARDTNGCLDAIDTVITVVAPITPTFTLTPTACYTGNNDGSIEVEVTDGNGLYQFSINSGPWLTPSPNTATIYTFSNLGNGTYTIDVRDSYGCPAAQQSVTLDPLLSAIVDVTDVSSCADGSISVTASGGDGNYAYAFVPTTTSPTGLFGPTNTFVVTPGNAGTYDVYVRDNAGGTPFCEYMETVTVNPAVALTFTATPTDPLCHDGVGTIEVNVTSGDNPYSLQIIDLDNGGASDQTSNNILNPATTFYNLAPGNYTINVTDSNGCTVTQTPITINNPDELAADIMAILPSACASADPNDFGFQFINYPSTLGTIEFSADGGSTWVADNSVPGTSDIITGYVSGSSVYPSMRTVDGLGNTICQLDLPRYIIPYPLDDLDISISTVVVNCNELRVTVQGTEGVAPYEYAFTDDPANFNPATTTWNPGGSFNNLGNPVTAGHGMYLWAGLIPGRTYIFYVRDSSGCIRQSNVNVNDITTNPLEIESTYEPSCSGANDGTITYTITDTDGNIEPSMHWEFYDISGSLIQSSGGNVPFNTTITVSGVAPGEYYIVVTEVDAGGVDNCISGSENLIIAELDPITATLNKLSDISCSTPGLIAIEDIQGGGGIYTYTVTGPAPFLTITGTPDNPVEIPVNSVAGPYNVTITDQYGCFTNLGTVVLDLTPNPTIDSMVVDNCASPTSLTINASSSAAQILYSIDGGTTYVDNGGVFNNLAPGSYNVAIIDSNGCTDTDVIDVYPVLEANVSLTKLLDCSISPDAEITVDVNFGSGNYDYEISNGIGSVVARTNLPSTPYVFSTTVPEDYTITIYDNGTSTPECNRVFTVTVPPAILPVLSITSYTDVTCNGADDGTIRVSATDGGISPYTFEIMSGSGSGASFPIAPTANTTTSATFEGLEGLVAPGITYTIRATAANGCTTDITQVITQPEPITNVNATVTEFVCTVGNNENNATITIDGAAITGGTGNYVSYEFIEEDDPNTAAVEAPVVVQSGTNQIYTETNTAGGSYTINVYDSNGCLGSTTAIIAPFDELTSATATITNTVTCTPGNDGELTMNAVSTLGDPSRFEYSIDNGANYQTSNIFGGLAAGPYTILARHVDTGCIISASETLLEPNTFTINVTKTGDVVCFGTDTGAVNVALVDATYPGGFTWTIYDTNGTLADTLDDTVVISNTEATNGPTADINLPAGSYYVSIAQDNNPFCVNTEAFTIAGPPAAITGAVNTMDITCVPGNDGIIEIINVAGGWGGYTYYIGVAAPSAPSDYLASPSLGGLSAGTYQAWVRDAQGCEQLIDNNIVLVDPTAISASLQVNQENCINLEGEIEVVGVTGGQGSNYTYQLILNGSNFRASQNTPVFSGLGAGSYEVEVIDQWGCSFITPAELLYEEMNLTTSVTKLIDCTLNPGGEITVNVTGSSTNLEFEMTTPLGSVVTQPSGIFTNLNEVGTYNFIVRDLDTTNPVCEKPISQELVAPITPVLLNATIINVSCNGGSDGSITAIIDPATNGNPNYQYELYDISDLVNPIVGPQNSPIFDNLAAGDYQVKVISGLGCEDVKNETITEPQPLVISATATTFDCAADNSINTATITVNIEDGAATPGILSGTGPYLYSLDNVNYQSANTFSVADNGLVQTITVYARDANGCPATDMVTIQPINRFTATVATDVDISCTNAESVTITVSDNGLAHNYTYELLPIGNTNAVQTGSTANSATFDLITTGSYTFRVTDTDTGCYYDTLAYNVEPYDFIRATATAVTPVTCFGDTNGEVEINIIGYTGTYQYEVFDAAGNSVIPATASDTNVNPRRIGGLSGGNYYVTITETDVPFCSEDTNMVTIMSPDMDLTAAIAILSQPTCTDDQGEILIDPSGGYAPYDIVMTNTTTGQPAYTATDVQAIIFTGLSAGNFDITVTDSSGCERDYNEVLVAATPIVANATPLITDLACYGDTGATVSANVTGGGSGSYEYQLNYYDDAGTTITFTTGQQLSPNFNDLGAGVYSITVTDGWNCDVTTNTVEITEPTLVEAFLIRTDPLTCATGAEFELTAIGGSGSYEYSVDNVTFLPMTSNPLGLPETGVLPAGTYQYYVRDAVNGCDAVVSNAITEDPIIPLSLVVDNSAAFINCTGEGTAAIYAQADGGLGNYQYELFTDVSLSIGSRIAGPQPNGVFRNLTAGTYYVSVTSEDCTTLPEEVIITEPTPLSYTEEIINITCAGENDGQITVTLSGGAGGYQYAISPNLNQFDTVNTFTDLSPGDYTVIAQDQNGCFEYLTYTLTEPTVLDVNATVTPEICVDSQDGSIILEITGGTAPYSTALNSNADADFVQDRTEFFDMATGNYLLFIRDANGCETNLVVDVERGVNLNATVEPIYECTGNIPNNYLNITLEDESVIGDVLYALDSVDPADLQLNPDFRNSTPGNHYITIAHANGCIQTIDFVIEAFEPLTLSLEQLNMNQITATAEGGRAEYTYFFDGMDNGNDNTFYITRTDTYEVRVVDENGCEAVASIFMEFIDIEIPNFFTPDGDGQNDFWIPRNMEQFPEILIKIFDRYGRVVSNQSMDSQGWDGLYSGKELPTGDYWYVIKLNGERDEREFVGHFTLYR